MEGSKDGFYLMAFQSASHSIMVEKKARELFDITVIPTPEELTNDCGLSIKFNGANPDAIGEFFKTLTIPADVYFLSNQKTDGKRTIKKLL